MVHLSTGLLLFYTIYSENPRWTMYEDVHYKGEAPIAIKRVETIRNVRRTAAKYL